MEHGGGAHTGADVGGAGGEVAEGGGEREFEFGFEGGVEFIGGLPCFDEVEAGLEGLEANVVLLVNHDGKAFVGVDDEAAPSVLGGMFSADEVFLDEELFIERGEGFHSDGNFRGAHGGKVGHGGLDLFEELEAIGFFEPTGEGEVFDVAS